MFQIDADKIRELAEAIEKDATKGGARQEFIAVISPAIYHGYWFVRRHIPFLRWLGRKLNSRRVYWLGLQIEWVEGMKDWLPMMDDIGWKWCGGYGETGEMPGGKA